MADLLTDELPELMRAYVCRICMHVCDTRAGSGRREEKRAKEQPSFPPTNDRIGVPTPPLLVKEMFAIAHAGQRQRNGMRKAGSKRVFKDVSA